MQAAHVTCCANCRVLESDLKDFSAYGSRTSAGVSLLVGRSLHADVEVVFAGDGGRLVVADVAIKSFKFRLVAVYTSNIAAERVSFIRRLAFVGAVTGNRWWVSLTHRIRDFATKYGRQINLDRTKGAKLIDNRLSRAVAGGGLLRCRASKEGR